MSGVEGGFLSSAGIPLDGVCSLDHPLPSLVAFVKNGTTLHMACLDSAPAGLRLNHQVPAASPTSSHLAHPVNGARYPRLISPRPHNHTWHSKVHGRSRPCALLHVRVPMAISTKMCLDSDGSHGPADGLGENRHLYNTGSSGPSRGPRSPVSEAILGFSQPCFGVSSLEVLNLFRWIYSTISDATVNSLV